jgi:signal transduction histidine kinase
MNLLSNAINYSKPSQCQIETSLQENEEEYIISVKDHGIGIAPEERNQIFQKFYRSEEAVKTATDGNGLGLYICKMLTERLGGKIWFESKGKNMGTTFYISIPNKKIF